MSTVGEGTAKSRMSKTCSPVMIKRRSDFDLHGHRSLGGPGHTVEGELARQAVAGPGAARACTRAARTVAVGKRRASMRRRSSAS